MEEKRCVFNPEIKCVRPDFRRVCKLDLDSIREASKYWGDAVKLLTPESMVKMHQQEKFISPVRYCPIYKEVFSETIKNL